MFLFNSLILSICVILLNGDVNPDINSSAKIAVYNPPTDSCITLSFSAVGDIMCHRTQFLYSQVKQDSFNFNPVFRVVKHFLKKSDVTIGNLETVIADDGSKILGYPVFNSPKELVAGLKYAGFDHLITANNHANDQGIDGIKNTIETLKDNNINWDGTRLSEENPSIKIYTKNKINYSILAYTYDVNYLDGKPKNRNLINFIDSVKIVQDINYVKSKNVDVAIVFFHFGKEYKKEPDNYQKKYTKIALDAGADVILACHPHVVQPIEIIVKNGNQKLLVNSMGNFVSNQRWRHSDGGVVINFNIQKNLTTGELRINSYSYLPIFVYKGNLGNGREFIILPSKLSEYTQVKGIFDSKSDSLMKLSYKDIKKQLTLYGADINEVELNNVDDLLKSLKSFN